MERIVDDLLGQFEHGRISRRHLVQVLALGMTAAASRAIAAPAPPGEQVPVGPERQDGQHPAGQHGQEHRIEACAPAPRPDVGTRKHGDRQGRDADGHGAQRAQTIRDERDAEGSAPSPEGDGDGVKGNDTPEQ